MELRTLTAGHAFLWVKNAIKILKKKPSFFVKSTLLFVLMAIAISIFDVFIPPMLEIFPATLIGVYFSAAVMLGSNAIFNASEQEIRSKAPFVSNSWGAVFKNKNIFLLAFISSIIATLFYFAAYWVFGSIFEQASTTPELLAGLSKESSQASALTESHSVTHPLFDITSAAIEIIASIPMIILFTMTPALVFWHKTPVAKAVFYNAYACFKNWKTWLCWVFIEVVFSIGIFGILWLISTLPALGANGTIPTFFMVVLTIALFALMLAIICLLLTAYYFAYKDNFASVEKNDLLNPDINKQSNPFDTF